MLTTSTKFEKTNYKIPHSKQSFFPNVQNGTNLPFRHVASMGKPVTLEKDETDRIYHHSAGLL